MKRAMRILATTTLLGAAAPQALALDISGSLDWSRFQVVLTDLDASDGVSSNIVWTNQHTGVNVLVIPPGGVVGQGSADWTGLIGVTQGPASASASPSSQSVDLTGMSPAVDYAEGNASRWGDFSLTAYTSARFILPASVTVANLAGHHLGAGATIWIWDGSNNFFDDLVVANGQSSARSLELTIDNPNGGSLNAHFNAGVHFMANPVPEPETWALLLAGLGLVSLVARRRA